jgi:hypothetical protein
MWPDPCTPALRALIAEIVAHSAQPTPGSANGASSNGAAYGRAHNSSGSVISVEQLIAWALKKSVTGRNIAGFYLAVQLRDAGLNQDEAERILLERYVPAVGGFDQKGIWAPYTEAEALASVRQAYSRPARTPWKFDLRFQHAADLGGGSAPPPSTPPASPPPSPPAPPGTPPPFGPQLVPPGGHSSGRPEIVVEPPWEPVIEQALDALSRLNQIETQLFVRGALLVEVVADGEAKFYIRPVDQDVMILALDRAAYFYRQTKKGLTRIFPSEKLAKLVRAKIGEFLRDEPGQTDLPRLDNIAETPVVRPDGTILRKPKGYDRDTFLYCALNPSLLDLDIPDFPTDDDLKWARETLHDALDDFCFSEPKEVNFANVLMALLTLPMRLVIGDDQTPILMINATTPGTGKTLLAKFICIVCLGHIETLTTAPEGRETGEWRKRITSFLLEGSNIVIVDNLIFTLESAELCAAVTSPVFADRLLGTNTKVRPRSNCFWIFTGNGLRPRGDLVRRCYWIYMDPQLADPTQRTGFRHGEDAEFLQWALENRTSLLRALFILYRNWVVRGCPPCKNPRHFGGFSKWSQLAAILECGGVNGALGHTHDVYVDPSGEEWEDFLEVIDQVTYGEEFTVVTLRNILREVTWNPNLLPRGGHEPSTNAQKLRDALPDGLAQLADRPGFTNALGLIFRQQKNRRYGATEIRIVSVIGPDGKVKKDHNKTIWKIETNE